MRIFLLLILLFNGISFAMQQNNPPFALLTAFLPQAQIISLDFEAQINHAVHNKDIVTVLFLNDLLEYTRTYRHTVNGYSCVYSGRMLPGSTPIDPAVVKEYFPQLIAQYGLKDKSPEQILASCILSKK